MTNKKIRLSHSLNVTLFYNFCMISEWSYLQYLRYLEFHLPDVIDFTFEKWCPNLMFFNKILIPIISSGSWLFASCNWLDKSSARTSRSGPRPRRSSDRPHTSLPTAVVLPTHTHGQVTHVWAGRGRDESFPGKQLFLWW